LYAIAATLKLDSETFSIKKTDQDRDRLPLSTSSFKAANPDARKFISVIGNKLIPYIEKI